MRKPSPVIPAKAGIQHAGTAPGSVGATNPPSWIPAFAGMTVAVRSDDSEVAL